MARSPRPPHAASAFRCTSRRSVYCVFALGCVLFVLSQWSLKWPPELRRSRKTASDVSWSRTPHAIFSGGGSSGDPTSCGALPPRPAIREPSAAERAQYQRVLSEQQPRDAPTLRQLLDEPRHKVPSITVVVEYADSGALCRQLHALVRQTASPEQILVSAMGDPDGDFGAAAQAVIDAVRAARASPPPISLVSVSSSGGSGGVMGGDAAARGFGRLGRFELALQSGSRHTLVLDSWVVPPPNALAALAHVSELPRGHGGKCPGSIPTQRAFQPSERATQRPSERSDPRPVPLA